MTGSRLLNHVEMVYLPGERRLVAKLFQALGCAVVDRGGTFMSSTWMARGRRGRTT